MKRCGPFRDHRRPHVLPRLVAIAVLAVALAAPGADAAEPGQIEKRIQTPKVLRGPVGPITAPELKPAPVAPPSAKFVLVGVTIAGSTVYRPAQLSFSYEDYLGREISLDDVQKILAAITKKYRDDGYILSRATAPAQAARLGILRLEIVEGFVERVEFKGDQPGGDRLLRAIAGRITANRPLRLAVLERYLLLLADAPGLRVFPALKPLDENRGAYLLEIGLKHKPIGGFVTLDNRGTTAVGPLQAFTGINLNSTLGLLERTSIAVFTIPDDPKELRYAQISHQQILNAEGTTAWIFASRSRVDTDEVGTGSKDQSSGTLVTLGISHPFIRSRKFNFTASLTFDANDSDERTDTTEFDDRLRVVRLGGQLQFKDELGGTNSFSLEASKGLDILNANDRGDPMVSRPGGRSDFFKVKVDAARRQNLAKDLHLLFTASGQQSQHTLLSSEEFTVGGPRFGRAYDPSIITGSNGAAGALELQFDSPFKSEAIRRIQFYGYFDIGAVWGAGVTRNSVSSAGGGLRISLPFDINAALEFGWPLSGVVTPGESAKGSPRVFFNILGKF